MIRDLAWLVRLGELGHVTDASAVLGTSQPNLSRALARVESELGVRIFERGPTGVEATPDGAIVLEAARELVDRHDLLRATLANRLDPDTGQVRLAFLDSMATTLVPKILRAFHAYAVGVKVVLSQEPAHDIRRDLARGAVELGLTMDRPDGDYGWLSVQRERLVLVVPPQHRLRDRKRVDLAEIAADELVTTPAGFGHSALVQGLLAEAGINPSVSFESAELARHPRRDRGLAARGPRVVPPRRAAEPARRSPDPRAAPRRARGLSSGVTPRARPPHARRRGTARRVVRAAGPCAR